MNRPLASSIVPRRSKNARKLETMGSERRTAELARTLAACVPTVHRATKKSRAPQAVTKSNRPNLAAASARTPISNLVRNKPSLALRGSSGK